MTIEELQRLYQQSTNRIDELAAKYYSGRGVTRRDCLEVQECNRRLRLVCYELWVRAGRPNDPESDFLRHPEPKRPLPKQFDLTIHPTEGSLN